MDKHSSPTDSPAVLASQRDQPNRSDRPASDPAGWTLDRLTLRLTKGRREALAEIADAEGNSLPPAEAIDRAIALACLFVRTSRPADGKADSAVEAIENGRQSSNSAADITEPMLEYVRHFPDAMADMAGSGFENGRHLSDKVADTPADLATPDHVIGPPLADIQSPTLSDWLAARLAEYGFGAATSAVVQVRPAPTTDHRSPSRIDCRLVAANGRRLIEGDVADWTLWGVADAARLPTDIGDAARLALTGRLSRHALWTERTASVGWSVFVHAFGSGGFEPAVAAFPMADIGRRPCLPVSAGTADI